MLASVVGRPTIQPIGTDPTTAAGQGRIMETSDQDLTPIMATGVALTMETMGVVMDLTLGPIMVIGVDLTMETMVVDPTMGTGGTMTIMGVARITETMDLTMGDGVIMMTMRADLTTEIMALNTEIMAQNTEDGEIMTVGLPMEIMAQITAGEVAQATTMKQQTIGATMETPPLTQISSPHPPWKS